MKAFVTTLAIFIVSVLPCWGQGKLASIPTDSLVVRDPFIFTDTKDSCYYLHVRTIPAITVYKSKNLKEWTEIGKSFVPEKNFWGKKDFWAPDLYFYNRKYYLIVTFSDESGMRGSSILVSDSPAGTFQPLVNGPITPREWMCLDASLYIDEKGNPWLVYCREWLDIKDGQIIAQRLRKDLKKTQGKPVVLFSASQAGWVGSINAYDATGYVTDAPFVYKTGNGKLRMLWSSFTKNQEYAIGIAESTTGNIEGPWEPGNFPINSDNGGHAMMFRDLQGNMKISYHAPNVHPPRMVIRDAPVETDIYSPACTDPVAGFFDQLPLLPRNNVQAGQFSSCSPHQRNGDEGHFLYRDEKGDAVIFDVSGPGCVTNMWGTVLDPEGILKFYFDDEEAPRYAIPVIEFYKGNHALFPKPFLSYERKGYYLKDSYAGNSFLPIFFSKSLRISMQGKPTFYHILYEKYPVGTNFSTNADEKRKEYIRAAFTSTGQNPWKDVELEQHATTIDLDAGQSLDLLKRSGTGAVRTIDIEMDTRKELLQDLRILMIWDDEAIGKKDTEKRLAYEKNENSRLYHVNAPIGFFFGTPHLPLELKSLPLSVTLLDNGRMRLSCYFTMPFWENARITLFNKSGHPAGRISASVGVCNKAYPREHTGYFTTRFRKGITEYGRDWIFSEDRGNGWFLGAVQSCRLEHYCEGNEHFYMDGNRTPQINGTGTEDYYLGCFWPNLAYHTPFAGCVNDVRIESGGDPDAFLVCLPDDYTTAAVYYRFHLDMPLPFYSSIDARIQHGGESQIESEYASLAYLYLQRNPILLQTDFLNVTNPESMKMHGYHATGVPVSRSLRAKYEGDYLYTDIIDSGLYHKDGEITFRVALHPGNNGVRIRRRTDQSIPRQKAGVYINGKWAGIWYDAKSNNMLCWYDSEFNIHPDFTRGKDSIEVTLAIQGDNDCNFTDFEYIILCYEN